MAYVIKLRDEMQCMDLAFITYRYLAHEWNFETMKHIIKEKSRLKKHEDCFVCQTKIQRYVYLTIISRLRMSDAVTCVAHAIF
jgi:hypothetical protein